MSLLELLIVGVLMSTLLLVSLGNPQGGKRRVGNRGVSEVLAQLLRNAKTEAVRRGGPVALVFPSAQGATPLATGCQLLVGRQKPTVREQFDFRRDYPDTTIFVGGLPGHPKNAQAIATGMEDDNFVLDSYDLPNPKDYALIFLPSGRVTSNGLPHHNGDYTLVVCGGAKYTLDSYPQPDLLQLPTCFTLQAAHQPFTLTVTALGQIRSQVGAPTSVELAPQALPGDWAHLSPAPQAEAAPPTIAAIRLLPDPKHMVRPQDVDSLVPKDGILTIQVDARSPQGSDLFLLAQDQTSQQPGSTSSDLWKPMAWNESIKLWTATTHWRPPATASDLSRYTVQVQIRDSLGNQSAQDRSAAIEVTVTQPKLRLTSSPYSGLVPLLFVSPNRGIGTVEEDATRSRLLTNPPPGPGHKDTQPSTSPDGQTVAYVRTSSPKELRAVEVDGSGDRLLFNGAPHGFEVMQTALGWSPSGTRIAFSAKVGEQSELFTIRPDGSDLTRLTRTTNLHERKSFVYGSATDLQWTDDESYLIIWQSSQDYTSGQLVKVATDGSGATPIYPGSVNQQALFTLAEGLPSAHTFLIATIPEGARSQYCRFDLNGGTPQRLDLFIPNHTFAHGGTAPALSPGNSRLALWASDGGGSNTGIYEGPATGPLRMLLSADQATLGGKRTVINLKYLDPSRLAFDYGNGRSAVVVVETQTLHERSVELPGGLTDSGSWFLAP